MTQIDRISKNVDEQWSTVIEALFAAKSRREAAALAGISPSTLYRMMQDEDFQRVLAEAERSIIAQTVTRLISEQAASVDTLIALRKEGLPFDAVKLKASLAILDRSVAMREALLVEERLSVLENLVLELAERVV